MVRQGYILKGNVLVGDLFTKYGLDANVLVDLALYPKAKEYFQQRGYSFPDKFLCTLHQCHEKSAKIISLTSGFL